ncbi:hypothetical protein [Aquirhabdus parva]|uniref:Uncharacterized protein n=1 Tax=Aquirhabdus parva TaxID=2283318 RepID=A0A345P9Q5_9GAMM|nr:hypothetical protein [Aquirhabdus parva]AXI04014.1 hypothetical protein HYN46_14890 [Aquirhabdus parva]
MNHKHRKEIFHILNQLDQYPKKLIKRANYKKKELYLRCLYGALATFVAAIIAGGLSLILSENIYLQLFALICLLISELLIIAAQILEIVFERKDILKFISQPSKVFLENANITTRIDMKFIPALLNFPREDIDLVKIEIAHERAHIEKRVAVVCGPIDKLGFFPSLLVTAILIIDKLPDPKTHKILIIGNNFHELIVGLVLIIMIFQFFSIFVHGAAAKLERIVQLLEHVSKLQKEMQVPKEKDEKTDSNHTKTSK